MPTRSRRRKSKRAKSRRKTRGGARIGKGAFGVAYRPPLLCDASSNVNEKYKSDKYVGKVMKEPQLQHEFDVSQKVLEFDPTHEITLPVEAMCKLAGLQTNDTFVPPRNGSTVGQLISEFGGDSLYSMFQTDFLDDYTQFSKIQHERFFDALRALVIFQTGFRTFSLYFVHGDLHTGNIVWDGSRARMIDFWFLMTIEERIQQQIVGLSGGREITELPANEKERIETEATRIASMFDYEGLVIDLSDIFSSIYVKYRYPRIYDHMQAFNANPQRMRGTRELYTAFFDELAKLLP
jgi:hypothetical protein